MDRATFDRRMMATAIVLAERGLGQTAPNPAVGAVIADDTTGEVIARGWTQPGGRPHAETEALARAGRRASGAAIYVTLEPCAHHGKTPPCAQAIIAAGITRAVVGVPDPDTRVAGRGVSMLREAGIAVDVGVLADEARWLTLGHILRVTEHRPFVQVKLAVDAAGRISCATEGRPVWVTGPLARAAGHRLRAEADAIVIGARTLAEDDPVLTCRLPGLLHRSPLRVIMGLASGVTPRARIFATAGPFPVWIAAETDADRAAIAALGCPGVSALDVASRSGEPRVNVTLKALATRDVTRLLVEGGPATWRAFAEAGVVDEVVLFHAEPHRAAPLTERQARAAVAHYLSEVPLVMRERRRLDADTMWRLRTVHA